ncbi:MAG TPA: leucyl aminopeptidase [Candidatus Cloacimonadota bacterium]|nr:leucyl aminopeptidase [Candidatus Cloacimonadota bacterium]HPS38603.1 leucyl aminopeptidase [Candidatus Cloacimonadota bacterium]
MKIDVIRKLPEHLDTVLIMHQNGGSLEDMELLPAELISSVSSFIKSDDTAFKYGKIKNFHHVCAKHTTKVILCGAGEVESLTVDKMRTLFANSLRTALKLKAKSVYLFLGFTIPISDVAFGHALAEAALLTGYVFDKYLSEDSFSPIETIHFVLNTKNTRHINKGILEGRIYAESTIVARDLVNEPANVIYPESLADAAKKAALQYGFSIDIHSVDKLRRIKMDAFLAVARGSKHEPKLIIMRYHGNTDHNSETIGLIGKGLTYDSGGYCIKTPQGMVNMKSDMGGAAAVIGTMAAVASLKLRVNVVAVVAACENMISGDAYRPGDIVRTMNGKTIEVINTDAEGRLTLVDAIHYAIDRENVDRVVDIATLTGAAVAALGNQFSAVLTNDEAWLAQLKAAAEFTGENIWQMPAHDDYKDMLKSEIADLKNVGGPLAGCITAGLFIREFVGDKPWIHIDIAGTAGKDKETGIYSYGATGVGVRLLTSLLKNME